jgi:hypothetical protein
MNIELVQLIDYRSGKVLLNRKILDGLDVPSQYKLLPWWIWGLRGVESATFTKEGGDKEIRGRGGWYWRCILRGCASYGSNLPPRANKS